jgi:hypothetical protein
LRTPYTTAKPTTNTTKRVIGSTIRPLVSVSIKLQKTADASKASFKPRAPRLLRDGPAHCIVAENFWSTLQQRCNKSNNLVIGPRGDCKLTSYQHLIDNHRASFKRVPSTGGGHGAELSDGRAVAAAGAIDLKESAK